MNQKPSKHNPAAPTASVSLADSNIGLNMPMPYPSENEPPGVSKAPGGTLPEDCEDEEADELMRFIREEQERELRRRQLEELQQ